MRLRKIDFLRGIAILLVLFRHHPFIDNTTVAAGWMGVDLFFVLSGFLVSGLLFNEYKRRDSVNIGRFFLRRGFKIYPLFYVTIVLVIFLKYVNENHWPPIGPVLSELFFLQSYITGLIPVTWSLAVEEHFYILVMLAVGWLVSARQVNNQKLVYSGWAFVAITCLVLRIINRVGVPFEEAAHVFPTHLRIDSLLAGVMISYTWHFNAVAFTGFINKNRILSGVLSAVLISLPFFFDISTVFMGTIGFTLVAAGFGLLLSLFLTSENIDGALDKILTKYVVNGIAKIGFYSYGIYLWHSVTLVFVLPIVINVGHVPDITILRFLIYAALGIAAGTFMSIIVEQPFLRIREKYFPHS